MSKYDDLYKEGTYVAVSGQQGLTAAGKVLEWDPANHMLHMETIPRYLMSNNGWVKNNSGTRITASFDPTGQVSRRISGTSIQEEYPVNQAIELRGKTVHTCMNQQVQYGVLATIDQQYFGLQPHIGSTLTGEMTKIEAPQLVPVQGTPISESPYTLEEILVNMQKMRNLQRSKEESKETKIITSA